MEKNEFLKRTAKEDKTYLRTLDDVIRYLEQAKKEEKNIYLNFNGNKLYSMFDDEDSCYIKVTGKNKKEFDEQKRQYMEEYKKHEEQEKKQAQLKIPYWITRGAKIIYPQLINEWIDCVRDRADGLYHGLELENAINIMECLANNGSFKDAKKILESMDHSGASYSVAMNIVVTFAKRGPEFYREVKTQITEEEQKILKQIEKDNESFEKELTETENE